MKTILLSGMLAIAAFKLNAQGLSGIKTGNYTGVNGVFYNPASIADSKFKYDVNLFSLDMIVSNNQASFNLQNLSQSFTDDKLEENFLGKNAGPTSGVVTLDFHGPSFMANIDSKNSFAFTTRARAFANVLNVDGKLLNQLSEDVSPDSDLPYRISSTENMRLSINAWTEFGLSYGRVIASTGQHFFKGGLTVKYLAGIGNGFVNVDHFNASLDADLLAQSGYVTNASGKVAAGFGGINMSDFEASDLTNFNGSGIGADLGVVYEYRPGGSKNYKLKLGAALLDLGKIKYEKDPQRTGSYTMNVPGNQRLYLDDLNDIDEYNSFFKAHPEFFTPATSNTESSYSVSLPTSFQLDADYNIANAFYVNLASQLSLSNSGNDSYNNVNYSSLTLTPRFEKKSFGVYLPVNYNGLSKFNAGLSLRAGPFFVGSGSVFTALLGNSKQADFHFGFRVYGLKR